MALERVSTGIDGFDDLLHGGIIRGNSVLIEGIPGAGKTTVVPISLLEEEWLRGKTILLLEPRRLAARNAATRMSSILREDVGQTV